MNIPKPFNGTAFITQTYHSNHKGVDWGLSHRTALISMYNGKVEKVQSKIEDITPNGVRNWIANTKNDPFKRQLGNLILIRKLKTEDYGNYILINHGNGIQTLVSHLDEVVVTEGQWVKKGELIGYSDSTGNSTGGHVHTEWRLNGVNIDPEDFIKRFPDFEGVFKKQKYEFFAYEGELDVSDWVDDGLLVREGPDTNTSTVDNEYDRHFYKPGEIVKVKGFVKGKRVEYGTISTQFWWVTDTGSYVWSGGTNVIPDLDNYPESVSKKFKSLKKEDKMRELKEKIAILKEEKAELEATRNALIPEIAQKQEKLAEVKTEIASIYQKLMVAEKQVTEAGNAAVSIESKAAIEETSQEVASGELADLKAPVFIENSVSSEKTSEELERDGLLDEAERELDKLPTDKIRAILASLKS